MLQANSFLVQHGMFSNSRIFIAPNGIEYKWKEESNNLRLINCQTKEVVVQCHDRQLGFLTRKSMPMNMDVTPQGFPFLDVIILTFIVMEKKRRERREQHSYNTTMVAAQTTNGC